MKYLPLLLLLLSCGSTKQVDTHVLSNPFTAPQIFYVIEKIPRWNFDKFKGCNRELGFQMKSVGEVMAVLKEPVRFILPFVVSVSSYGTFATANISLLAEALTNVSNEGS